jgi:restriction system protein
MNGEELHNVPPQLLDSRRRLATGLGWENNSWWDASVRVSRLIPRSIEVISSVAFVPPPLALADVASTIAQESLKVSLSLSGIITPGEKVASGILVAATSFVWVEIARRLGADWAVAYQIGSREWEEIIAGAFDKAGYDEVILTPRSGDHGRDVIAMKKGVGSVKILGSVKANGPDSLVRYDDVRALLGVLSGERDASKGMVITTSDFPARIGEDLFIAPFLPTRLELMNGQALREWLIKLSNST